MLLKGNVFALFYLKSLCFRTIFFRVNLHFKKSYTEYRKLSFQDSHKKVLEFMREYDEDYRADSELTVSEESMFAAETYMEKNQHLFLTKVSRDKCRNGRTTLKPDSVVHRGITKKIVVMPLGEMTRSSKEQFGNKASKFSENSPNDVFALFSFSRDLEDTPSVGL